MLNKLLSFVRKQKLIFAGDTVICALSGGADSVALLFALYLLKEKLEISLEAAHFNHHLRGEESNRDEAFVKAFCDRYDIPLHLGSGQVTPGKKGLEAAAREARYGFLRTLKGKIATAHTADDNAETVLMHLVRGTGLKGLGGISPVYGSVIRPMLSCTRQDVESFLEEWCLDHVEDSSNESDDFLRNRIRHRIVPLLKEENPKLAENLSAMALRLREDEQVLSSQTDFEILPTVESLKAMPKALRSRCLDGFLKKNGVREPEESHIAMAEALVFSENPSARASFPGGITIARRYDRLEAVMEKAILEEQILTCPGILELPELRIECTAAEEACLQTDCFTVYPVGKIRIRPRKSGDSIRLSGGTKSLKKLFVDRKIPAEERLRLPVICDDAGVLGVYSIGANLDRISGDTVPVTIRFIKNGFERITDS